MVIPNLYRKLSPAARRFCQQSPLGDDHQYFRVQERLGQYRPHRPLSHSGKFDDARLQGFVFDTELVRDRAPNCRYCFLFCPLVLVADDAAAASAASACAVAAADRFCMRSSNVSAIITLSLLKALVINAMRCCATNGHTFFTNHGQNILMMNLITASAIDGAAVTLPRLTNGKGAKLERKPIQVARLRQNCLSG
jgi:hypothetical protein